jgi:hypothetical protein
MANVDIRTDRQYHLPIMLSISCLLSKEHFKIKLLIARCSTEIEFRLDDGLSSLRLFVAVLKSYNVLL